MEKPQYLKVKGLDRLSGSRAETIQSLQQKLLWQPEIWNTSRIVDKQTSWRVITALGSTEPNTVHNEFRSHFKFQVITDKSIETEWQLTQFVNFQLCCCPLTFISSWYFIRSKHIFCRTFWMKKAICTPWKEQDTLRGPFQMYSLANGTSVASFRSTEYTDDSTYINIILVGIHS